MSNFSSESNGGRVVSALTVEAARLIREVAPPAEGENVKSRIRDAATKLRWKLSRARDVWNASRKIRVGVDEIAALRRATETPLQRAAREEIEQLRKEREAARADLQELRRERVRLATLLDRANRIDADFAGPLADPARHQLQQLDRAIGSLDRTGTGG